MSGTAERVVVVGGGIAGLVAARDLARAGRAVTLLETGTLGGSVASHEVAGLVLDAGAESFATRSTTVADLLAELGLAADVVVPARTGAWVQLPDGAVPLPSTGLLGIPADPWSPDVRRAIGVAGAARAALDRVLPATWGVRPGADLAGVVRARMGRRVLDRLVAPVVAGVHSSDPRDVDVEAVLPGLRERMRRTGSLGAAVSEVRRAAPAGSAVAGLRGGLHRLVVALEADLHGRGVDVRTGTPVTGVDGRRGAWDVRTPGDVVVGERLVLAVPAAAAAGLLPALAPFAPQGATEEVVLATLVVDAPGLDAAPRGTGVLVAPGSGVQAKALTHATAKWAWLAAAAGPGRHVLRLSYGRPGGAPPPGDALVDVALADAARLLGVPLGRDALVDAARTTWRTGLPTIRPGHAERTARVRADAAAAGVVVCGAWVAGTGLAAVVADTRRQVAEVAAGSE